LFYGLVQRASVAAMSWFFADRARGQPSLLGGWPLALTTECHGAGEGKDAGCRLWLLKIAEVGAKEAAWNEHEAPSAAGSVERPIFMAKLCVDCKGVRRCIAAKVTGREPLLAAVGGASRVPDGMVPGYQGGEAIRTASFWARLKPKSRLTPQGASAGPPFSP